MIQWYLIQLQIISAQQCDSFCVLQYNATNIWIFLFAANKASCIITPFLQLSKLSLTFHGQRARPRKKTKHISWEIAAIVEKKVAGEAGGFVSPHEGKFRIPIRNARQRKFGSAISTWSYWILPTCAIRSVGWSRTQARGIRIRKIIQSELTPFSIPNRQTVAFILTNLISCLTSLKLFLTISKRTENVDFKTLYLWTVFKIMFLLKNNSSKISLKHDRVY